MWIQCAISRDDFAQVLNKVLPLRVQLEPGTATSGVFYLSKAKHVSLVPDRGLRIRVQGHIQWPVLGVSVPVTLREVQLVLEPHIVGKGRKQRLTFIPVVEQADVVAVPGFVEHWLIPKLNKQLASPSSEFAWKFMNTLHLDFPLPAQLDPVRKMGLRVNWGEVKVTRDALSLALSLRLKVVRGERVRPLDEAPPSEPEPESLDADSMGDPGLIANEPALPPVSDSRPAAIDERSNEPAPPVEIVPRAPRQPVEPELRVAAPVEVLPDPFPPPAPAPDSSADIEVGATVVVAPAIPGMTIEEAIDTDLTLPDEVAAHLNEPPPAFLAPLTAARENAPTPPTPTKVNRVA